MAAPIYADRVKETTTTTGTGTLSLGGTVTGYQTFVIGVGNGNTTKILIDDGNGNWELCFSVVTSGTPATLSRGTLINSSTGSRVSFAAGTKTVALVPATDWFAVPTKQVLLSGSSATYTTPAGARQIRIRMIGGGGGGGGNSTSASDGGVGGTTSFNGLTAIGGSGGLNGGAGGAGGTGGTNVPTSGSVTGIYRINGGGGSAGMTTNNPTIASNQGGEGASGAFGGGAKASSTAGATNSGGGGSGNIISGATGNSGGGGGSGEYVEFIINNPAATYTYTVGAAGTAGTSAGTGGTGVIIVDEIN